VAGSEDSESIESMENKRNREGQARVGQVKQSLQDGGFGACLGIEFDMRLEPFPSFF
jgi:hypothetical protein